MKGQLSLEEWDLSNGRQRTVIALLTKKKTGLKSLVHMLLLLKDHHQESNMLLDSLHCACYTHTDVQQHTNMQNITNKKDHNVNSYYDVHQHIKNACHIS